MVFPVLVATLLTSITGPWVIRRESGFLRIERARLTLAPPTITLENVQLAAGDPRTTGYEAKAARIVASLQPTRLFFKELVVPLLRFEGLNVVVTEGDLPTPAPQGVPGRAGWTCGFLATELLDARFTYVRLSLEGKHPRRSELRVVNIQGSIDRLGTLTGLEASTTHASVTGRLECSGSFQLSVATPLLSPELAVDIGLRMRDQNLADLNAFFEKNDGIRFAGSLYQGHGVVTIQGRSLRSRVAAKYQGLDIRFQKTDSRTALAAFFSNVAGSANVGRSSLIRKSGDQVRSVVRLRELHESLLHFIFRGLRDAALQVATVFTASPPVSPKARL